MPIDSVSNYALFQATSKDVTKVESDLASEQMQLSSGNAAQNFSDMSGQAKQYLSLDNSISRTSQYLTNNRLIESRIDATSSSLGQVITTASSLQSLISQRISATGSTAFPEQVQGLWQSLTGELNSSVAGQYLFSGTAVNTPAVDTHNLPKPPSSTGVPDTSYYLGSNQDMTVSPQDNTSITYNIRADAPGFQKVFAAIAMASKADANNDTTGLQQAYTMLQDGISDVTAMQATANGNKITMTGIDTNLTSVKQYWQGLKDSIGNTDILTVSTQVAVNQGILQAAFQAFAKINSLRLSDYLK